MVGAIEAGIAGIELVVVGVVVVVVVGAVIVVVVGAVEVVGDVVVGWVLVVG